MKKYYFFIMIVLVSFFCSKEKPQSTVEVDVYVAGTVHNGTSVNGLPNGIATHCKNEKAITLADGSKWAFAS